MNVDAAIIIIDVKTLAGTVYLLETDWQLCADMQMKPGNKNFCYGKDLCDLAVLMADLFLMLY